MYYIVFILVKQALYILFPGLEYINDWKLWTTVMLSALSLTLIESYRAAKIKEAADEAGIDISKINLTV